MEKTSRAVCSIILAAASVAAVMLTISENDSAVVREGDTVNQLHLQGTEGQQTVLPPHVQSQEISLLQDLPALLRKVPSHIAEPLSTGGGWNGVTSSQLSSLLKNLDSPDKMNKAAWRLAARLLTARSIKKLRHLSTGVFGAVQERREKMANVPTICGDSETCESLEIKEENDWSTEHQELAATLNDPAVREAVAHVIRKQLNHIKATNTNIATPAVAKKVRAKLKEIINHKLTAVRKAAFKYAVMKRQVQTAQQELKAKMEDGGKSKNGTKELAAKEAKIANKLRGMKRSYASTGQVQTHSSAVGDTGEDVKKKKKKEKGKRAAKKAMIAALRKKSSIKALNEMKRYVKQSKKASPQIAVETIHNRPQEVQYKGAKTTNFENLVPTSVTESHEQQMQAATARVKKAHERLQAMRATLQHTVEKQARLEGMVAPETKKASWRQMPPPAVGMVAIEGMGMDKNEVLLQKRPQTATTTRKVKPNRAQAEAGLDAAIAAATSLLETSTTTTQKFDAKHNPVEKEKEESNKGQQNTIVSPTTLLETPRTLSSSRIRSMLSSERRLERKKKKKQDSEDEAIGLATRAHAANKAAEVLRASLLAQVQVLSNTKKRLATAPGAFDAETLKQAFRRVAKRHHQAAAHAVEQEQIQLEQVEAAMEHALQTQHAPKQLS